MGAGPRTKESIITEEDTGCFCVERYSVSEGKVLLDAAPAIYVVTKGEGKVTGDGYSRMVRQGDYFPAVPGKRSVPGGDGRQP